MINLKRMTLAIVMLVGVNGATYAFNNGDVIGFDPGVEECLIPGICDWIPDLEVVTSGSYFALDTNGDGFFSLQERVAISPGPDGGIVLGVTQPAPGIDEPWFFAFTYGQHQTSTIPVTQNPDGTLNLDGLEVVWNDMVIQLTNEHSALVSCSSAPCNVFDQYHIDYTARVANSPFAGVGYQLHLENVDNIPSIEVSLSVVGGEVQECSSTGGNNILVESSIELLNGAQLATLEWLVDGHPAGSGASITPFLSLGMHTIQLTATTLGGLSDSASVNVRVVDTTAPTIHASFIDSRSGSEISSIETNATSFVGVSLKAEDVCDASPSISAVGGFNLTDGDALKIQGNLDKVELTTSILQMSVTASDASANDVKLQKQLNITP